MDIDYKTTITVTASISQLEFYQLDRRAIATDQPLFEWLADNFASLCDSIEFDQGKLQIIAECDPLTAVTFACRLRGANKMNSAKIKLEKQGRSLDQFVDSMQYSELLRGLPLVLDCTEDLEIVAEVTETKNFFIVTASC